MSRIAGLDFGTTNSALALIDGDARRPRLASFRGATGESPTFRSVLYFSPEQIESHHRPHPICGPRAIDRYLTEDDGTGRLIQSMKTWLGSRLFTQTLIGRRETFSIEALIGHLLTDLRAEAEAQLGPLGRRIVVGRPVHLSQPADPERDEVGMDRLRTALAAAGFDEITFVFEPVAAAYHYEQRLDRDEVVLIADFGGGTSDFSLIRVGPEAARRRRAEGEPEILGAAGVPLAGNAFDSRIVQHLVAPHLGLGSHYRTPFGRQMEIPPSIFKLRWHELSMLRTRDTLEGIRQYRASALEPQKLAAFEALVEFDLGYQLYRAVEQAKVALSERTSATFCFQEVDIDIKAQVDRADFEAWIEPELASLERCVDDLFERAGLPFSLVDRVFLTGGSSFIPAVRQIFARRFGADRLRTGEELTSVASGLALVAADRARA